MSQVKTPLKGTSFSDLGLSEKLLSILKGMNFTTPTPIQLKAIPVAIAGKDVIGIAQTGTGKTLAFGLPMIQELAKSKKQGLVVVPTRELAIQVEEQFLAVGRSLGLKQAVLIGGASMGRQIQQLRQNPHIIIATPGRLIDHLKTANLSLRNVGVLVLDEADRMLDMGFAPQIMEVLNHVPKNRQTLLFSATMPSTIVKIANQHMKMPVRVEVARAGSVADKVYQESYIVRNDDKGRLLEKLLGDYKGTVLVFSRTKYGAKKICRVVKQMGHSVAEIHSNLSLSQRRRSMEGFKSGQFRVLVATDIAARGIDVNNIELVINYDLPESPDDYVHRVGRTGRAGKKGHAISFIMPDQKGKVRIIERLVQQQLRALPLPDLPARRSMPYEPDSRGGRGGHRSHGGRGNNGSRGGYGNRGNGGGRGNRSHRGGRGRNGNGGGGRNRHRSFESSGGDGRQEAHQGARIRV